MAKQNGDPVLEVKDLHTYFFNRWGVVKAVDGVSFSLRQGETLGIVGESGCGKTMTALSLLRLIPRPAARIVKGEIVLDGEDLIEKTNEEMRQIRGRKISMILQDPQTSLNPVFTIGNQIIEALGIHQRERRKTLVQKAVDALKSVKVAAPERRLEDFPYQMSGGMKQRVIGAIAISCAPKVIIADEPTTALDVTIKAQILDILNRLTEERRMSLLFITHDLGVVAEIADRIVVMYGGRLVEAGTSADIFDNPKHPYTWGLIKCLPDMSQVQDRLTPIPGMIPSLIDPPQSCIFHPRCPQGMPICTQEMPPQITISGEHTVVCQLYKPPSGTYEKKDPKR